MKNDIYFWKELKKNKEYMTKQQYRTIKGQAVKGHVADARKGLMKLKRRRCS